MTDIKQNNNKEVNFSKLINQLFYFWSQKKDYNICSSSGVRVAAGTMNLISLLKVLNYNNLKEFSLEKCCRPNDSIGTFIGCRTAFHTQLQIFTTGTELLDLDNFFECLEYLQPGISEKITLKADDWEHFVLSAKGKGWEVLYSGLEIAQITYFNSIGGIELKHEVLELAIGIERLALILSNKFNIEDLKYNKNASYIDIHRIPEEAYNKAEIDNIPYLKKLLEIKLELSHKLSSKKNYFAAIENIIDSSQILNELSDSIIFEEKNDIMMYMKKIIELSFQGLYNV